MLLKYICRLKFTLQLNQIPLDLLLKIFKQALLIFKSKKNFYNKLKVMTMNPKIKEVNYPK